MVSNALAVVPDTVAAVFDTDTVLSDKIAVVSDTIVLVFDTKSSSCRSGSGI